MHSSRLGLLGGPPSRRRQGLPCAQRRLGLWDVTARSSQQVKGTPVTAATSQMAGPCTGGGGRAQKPSAIMQWGIVARSQEKPRVQSQKCMYGAMRCPNGTMGALAHDLMIPHAAGYAASCRWPWLPAAVHEGPAMGLRVRSCISKDLMIPLAASYRRPWLRCCCLLSQVQLVLKL